MPAGRGAGVLREHAEELAMLDAINTGNPVAQMVADAKHRRDRPSTISPASSPRSRARRSRWAAALFNYTVREPLGVVARIVAYNHPLMFAAMKIGAPLAAGNTVVVKPPEQAPLSALRMAELIGGVFPPGVLNVLAGGKECGQALATHPLVRKVTLIGSVPTGKAIMRAAADTLKPVLLELGGKNALIAYPDADVDKVIAGAVRGMNFTWAGQSCGSTSRVFLHESIHDRVLDGIVADVAAQPQAGHSDRLVDDDGLARQPRAVRQGDGLRQVGPGRRRAPGDRRQAARRSRARQRLLRRADGVRRCHADDAHRARGDLRAGPRRYSSGATRTRCSTRSTPSTTGSRRRSGRATSSPRIAPPRRVEAGYVWINNASAHFLGAPFGGYKQSGIGREESFEELLEFTQTKNVNVNLDS